VLDQASRVISAVPRDLMTGLTDCVDGWITHWLLL
jgi:hypothetical protein